MATALSTAPAIAGVAVALSSCSGLGYYADSVSGQIALLLKREPISRVLSGPQTPPDTRQKLKTILYLRSFAVTDLALPDNGSYLTFVDLNRSYVAWNVFATPEFSLQPLNWCFPVAGCFSYHGYFSEQKAQGAARYLSGQGYDVHVGGVAAYSTLGWFKDPILSPMLKWRDTRIAEVIFHELAHQLIYVSGDTAFNEAFATATANNGVRRWLMEQGSNEALASFDTEQVRRREFASMVLRTTRRLRRLYSLSLEHPAMRFEKERIFKKLVDDYRTLRIHWGDYSAYDAWIASGLNNAKLSSILTYHGHVDAFNALFEAASQRFPDFYEYVREVGHLPAQRRQACLRQLSRAPIGSVSNCPPAIERQIAGAYHRQAVKPLMKADTRT